MSAWIFIDRLWLSIASDAERGDAHASAALDLNRPLEPEILAELKRRVEELKRNPSSGTRWEYLRAEFRRKLAIVFERTAGNDYESNWVRWRSSCQCLISTLHHS